MGKWNFTSSLRPKVQTCCHFLTKKTVGSDSGGVKGILFNQENLVGLDLDMLALRKKAVRFFLSAKKRRKKAVRLKMLKYPVRTKHIGSHFCGIPCCSCED